MESPVIERKRGVIKIVFRAKLYGFIQVTPKEEYFFHSTALQGVRFNDLTAGDAVSFMPTTGKEGKPRAVGIRRIDVDSGGSTGSSGPAVEDDHAPEAGGLRKQEDAE